MSLNDTPSGERIHIGFFGRRNAGKSSLVNAVTGQDLAVVSDRAGTTTDPVYKAMEILPMGPVMIIDTPGFDDEGELGELRVKKTRQILNRADCAVLVCDCTQPLGEWENRLISIFEEKKVPYIIARNKCDLLGSIPETKSEKEIYVSAVCKTQINALREKIAGLVKSEENSKRLVGDIIRKGEIAVLVVPIDSSAPKGRLILPQQQAIRDILESSAISVAVKDTELKDTLKALGQKPAVVITDSQAFGRVSRDVPKDIKLTSFSILMARYKGFLDTAVQGAAHIDRLKDGDKILISEGCTHHRQCEDIGTVKLPKWLKEYTGKELEIITSSGREFPENLNDYALIIHCGGCMLGRREMLYRMKCAEDRGVPFTNYGTAIAHINGILKRSLEVFPDLYEQLSQR